MQNRLAKMYKTSDLWPFLSPHQLYGSVTIMQDKTGRPIAVGPEVGIYKRNQESKKTRQHAFDQESN